MEAVGDLVVKTLVVKRPLAIYELAHICVQFDACECVCVCQRERESERERERERERKREHACMHVHVWL